MSSEAENSVNFSSFVQYGNILLKWSWLILVAACIVSYGVFYYTNLQPRVYQASTVVVVNMPSGVSDVDATTQSLQLTTTYARTMITHALLQEAARKLSEPVTSSVTASADVDTPTITITVRDRDPQKAADTANAVAEVFIEEVDARQSERYTELETSIEDEIARIDQELESINEKLANLVSKDSETDANISAESDPETFVMRSQLELSLSQYTQTRYSLVYNLQQIKLSEIRSKTIITQLDPAAPRTTPIQPQPVRSAIIGGVVGLLAIGGLIFLIAYLKDQIYDPREITQLWGVPILGFIPKSKKKQDEIISLAQPRAPMVEAFKVLRTNLEFANVDKPLHSILITSPSAGDGKWLIASNLAVVTGQNNKDVLLVDCDLRKPTLHKLFQVSNHQGLTHYLMQQKESVAEVVHGTKTKGLYVMTSGSLPPNPSELLNSHKMTNMINGLNEKGKTVILDSPPVLIVADALVLAPRVDGVILIVDLKQTKRSMIFNSVKDLKQVNANLLGVVINRVRERSSYNYYYYSSKYYGNAYSKVDEVVDEE